MINELLYVFVVFLPGLCLGFFAGFVMFQWFIDLGWTKYKEVEHEDLYEKEYGVPEE